MVLLGLIAFFLIFSGAVLGFWLFTSALFLWIILFFSLSAIFLAGAAVVFLGTHWSFFLLACLVFLGFFWSVYFFRCSSEPVSGSSENKKLKKFLIILTFFVVFLCFFSYFFFFQSPEQVRFVIHEYTQQTQPSHQEGFGSVFL